MNFISFIFIINVDVKLTICRNKDVTVVIGLRFRIDLPFGWLNCPQFSSINCRKINKFNNNQNDAIVWNKKIDLNGYIAANWKSFLITITINWFSGSKFELNLYEDEKEDEEEEE